MVLWLRTQIAVGIVTDLTRVLIMGRSAHIIVVRRLVKCMWTLGMISRYRFRSIQLGMGSGCLRVREGRATPYLHTMSPYCG